MALRSLPSPDASEPLTPPVVHLSAEDASPTRGPRKREEHAWQREGWGFYDNHGEVHYPIRIGANLAARVDLVPQERNSDGAWVATTNREALACHEMVVGQGLDDYWSSLWTLTGIPGEGVLLVQPSTSKVELCSTSEVVQEASGKWVRKDDTGRREVLSLSEYRITSFWRPHPRYRRLPDSGLRSVLNECRELELLKLALLAKISSRLASVGILFLPNSISMPAPEGATGTLSGSSLVQMLTAMFQATLRNPGSAAAAMPVILQGPDDAGEKIRHIILDTSLDEVEERHRQELRRAIANGIELPIETQTSVSDTNHWQAWHVSESALHDHVLPVCRQGANLLTTRVLHPWLRTRGIDPTKYRLAADGRRAALGLNSMDASRQLYERGAISLASLRERHGFGDADAPDVNEFIRWLGVKLNNPLMATWELPVAIPPEVLSGPTPPGMGGFDAAEPAVDGSMLPGDPAAGLDQS